MNAPLRPLLIAWPALLFAAACSGNAAMGPASAPSLPSTFASSAAARADGAQSSSGGYVYVCTLEPKCSVFTADGQRVRTVTKGLELPVAIVSDPQGNVYVGDAGAGQIAIYAPGMTKRIATRTGVNVGFDIALHDGTLAVSGGTSVEVFPAGSGTPTILTDSEAMQGNGIAFDSQGNCYWSLTLNDGLGTVRVDEFAGCAGAPNRLDIPGSPMWLAFDGNDNLYYANPAARAGIYRCAKLAQCAIAYRRSPRAIRFDQGWQHLYAADLHGPTISRIDIATGKIDETIKRGFQGYSAPIGLAAGPGPD